MLAATNASSIHFIKGRLFWKVQPGELARTHQSCAVKCLCRLFFTWEDTQEHFRAANFYRSAPLLLPFIPRNADKPLPLGRAAVAVVFGHTGLPQVGYGVVLSIAINMVKRAIAPCPRAHRINNMVRQKILPAQATRQIPIAVYTAERGLSGDPAEPRHGPLDTLPPEHRAGQRIAGQISVKLFYRWLAAQSLYPLMSASRTRPLRAASTRVRIASARFASASFISLVTATLASEAPRERCTLP